MATHYRQGSNNWLASLGLQGVVPTVAGLDFSRTSSFARGDDVDTNPDYDASDEIEYGVNWWAWILRGVYPPPAYPPV